MSTLSGKTPDQVWMARALKLAAKGLYSTSPNPRVGCVIVGRDADGNEVVVGEGWHQKAGEPHAEVNALRAAGERARGATAYVTLEPCSHYGRTPPCAKGLIEAGVARVVAACADPNPQVAGRGYGMLRDAGVDVTEACLAAEAEQLNVGFMKRMRTGLPYVRIKLAQSLDGRTAMQSGESQWITGPQARSDVQRLRARSCAVITGADSVLIDNPSMTVRPAETGIEQAEQLWRQPLRVLVDSRQRVTPEAKLFSLAGDILIACHNEPGADFSACEARVSHWQAAASNDKVDLEALLRYLAEQGCNEVLVESGAQLAGAFVAAGLVDELVVYTAPTLLGSNARPLLNLPFDRMQQQLRWQWQDVRMVGNDLRLTLTPAATEQEEH
ncbi:bifunctional diaminohydroxyphosphoribosylaminopyrimidine deaminase/5-amino-6-(5-phosphoribosylamino)uracil reductase RibD [Oceanobacter kriegii]|uniref:bifunctional diaminohydroxyphosphoribosylaminopyrimidine deaminase/5-amino-6-(5-phosphoribosylamino)uracil reductase RibD n=1 Tax=Oceanobacter kriegii TaxID=64972 RepID=UPI0003F8B0E1|nr:bifunctional diaminohydroxyphosphoribosylaminopyrimidine deaminase/5-amino-6-(5-phosphoribosylamino)uracil reductase RibD [Oceanobacter kriegii]